MSLESRIKKLEGENGGEELPLLVLKQDLHELDLFRDNRGNTYRYGSPEWPDKTHSILEIVWDFNWRDVEDDS